MDSRSTGIEKFVSGIGESRSIMFVPVRGVFLCCFPVSRTRDRL